MSVFKKTFFETNCFLIECLEDNYAFVLQPKHSSSCLIIDPAQDHPVLSFLEKEHLTPTWILNTHHHSDHTGGNLAIQKVFSNCKIGCSQKDQHRIPGAQQVFDEQEYVFMEKLTCQVLHTPGHTLGHLCYFFPELHLLFTGDTLFRFGCGRIFEGTYPLLYQSLQKILSLPSQTNFFCAHEYTYNNLKFALSLFPNHPELQTCLKEITSLRKKNQPSLPGTLEEERKLNPFYQTQNAAFLKRHQLSNQDPETIFTWIRKKKDLFKKKF